MPESNNFLLEAVIFLGAAVICVPLAKRMGVGSVIGYLAAGVIIGPYALQWIDDAESILHFAEFGVVLLLFLIGLELNPAKLWELRQPIFGMGALQVVVTTAIFFAIASVLGLAWPSALIASMALSLSSTAIALQSMTEKNLLNTPAGKAGFSVLLFQDIAVIPMIAVLPLLGMQGDQHSTYWLAVIKAVAVIAMIIVGGHYLLRPLFRIVAQTGSREVFTAFSLFIVIGTAVLMHSVGLSMALGTFLAGVLLADSEYLHQLETDVEPFKGLLLGLFFISVGMSVNLSLLVNSPWIVAALTVALVVVKFFTLWFIGRLNRLEQNQDLLFSLLLAQGGEFAFVLLSAASGMPEVLTKTLILVVALSMIATPLLLLVYMCWIEPLFARIRGRGERAMPVMEQQNNKVIIAGFGRFGQIVARLLHVNGIYPTIIDHSPDHIERVGRFGFKVYYGDATRIDLLETAGAKEASLLVLAMDDRLQINTTAEAVKEHFPQLTVLARAWDMVHVYELLDRGVKVFRRETFESALSLGEDALIALHTPAYQAKLAANKFRTHDFASLYRLYEVHKDEEKLISTAQEAREELEKLFKADQNARQKRHVSWG